MFPVINLTDSKPSNGFGEAVPVLRYWSVNLTDSKPSNGFGEAVPVLRYWSVNLTDSKPSNGIEPLTSSLPWMCSAN